MAIATKTATVDFLHYGSTANVGDYLCSPRHYFELDCNRPTLIVGGGASNNFFCGRARQRRASVRIAWGIGQSFAFGSKPSQVDRLLKMTVRRLTYTRASTRDPGLASDQLPLVPCVSVFHPVTETPLGREVGIFVNASDKVSGAQHAIAADSAHAFVATNGLKKAEFMRAFARTGTIITNSYHAAYWGLLSGRSVHIIGYSSKFTNLAALFGFPESAVVKVHRGDGAALARAVKHCASREPLKLDRPADLRWRFRQQNLDFARRLQSVGVFAELKHGCADA